MRWKTYLLVIVSIIIVDGCTTARVDTQAEGEALMQLSREWSASVATGDLEATLEFWADDAIVMPPGMPPVRGKEAIRGFVSGMTQIPGFQISWEPVSVHVSASGDMAYMVERNTSTMDDAHGNPVTTHGKVITIWRSEPDGSWKNVIDMWNEDPR